MSDLPSGTVTFLFTDVEGSTKLLHELGPKAYAEALHEHRRLLRNAFVTHGGVEVDTEGDAFFVAFPDPAEAVAAAKEAQESMASGPIRVRMGLHTGTPHVTEQGYVGVDVHKGARIAASSHGGQVVLSKETRTLLDERFALLDLGEHRVKDFAEPVWIYQLGAERFPPLKTISNTNLPRPVSSFVGREREVAELGALLRDGARLVTLTGPGGTGKTRLALEAAADLVPAFKNGVFWVGLSAVRDPALVPETIGQTIGAKNGLAEHIGEREMLLLVDNLEQVVAAAPELASLAEACPNLRLLVTSRERLRVRGETEYAVPPLADAEAVTLFCDRARLEPDDTILELCRQLDDLPLAVELAAARATVLTPTQILERLSSRLDLLKGGRDTEARRATLRATIEWSHDLLAPAEQQLFARLSVFRGGWTLEAAERVAEADIDNLQSLVDKSLVRRTDERFSMLETIREYAAERMARTGDVDAIKRRHAQFFLALAEEINPHRGQAVHAASQVRLDRLEAEHDNLRVALDWFGQTGAGELEQRLAASILRFWQIRGHYAEATRRLEHAIAADERPTEARAWALFSAAVIEEGAQSKQRFEAALALFESLGDSYGIARVRMNLGIMAIDDGELDRARETLEASIGTFEQAGDEFFAIYSLRMLAWANHELGDTERARDQRLEVVRRAHAIGASHIEANALSGLGEDAVVAGRVDEAADFLRRSLSVYVQLKDPEFVAVNLFRFARLMVASERPEAAAELLGRGDAAYEEIGKTIEPWLFKFNAETRAAVRDRLDDVRFADASERGRRLSTEEAVAIALGETDRDA